MPHVDTQTRLTGSRIDEFLQELHKMKHRTYCKKHYRRKRERQQAKGTSAGATKQMMGFKRWVATKDTSADATRQNTGIKRWVDTKVTSADATRQKTGIKRLVETKVTSADAASSTSADAASSSPSAVHHVE